MQDADAACGGLSHHFGIELTLQRGPSERYLVSSSCPTSHRSFLELSLATYGETLKCAFLKSANHEDLGRVRESDLGPSLLYDWCLPSFSKDRFLVNAHLVPSLNPQTFALWRFDHVTQTTSSCDTAVRHRGAIAVSDCFAMLSQFLPCNHDWHRALGNEIVGKAAQQHTFDCTASA